MFNLQASQSFLFAKNAKKIMRKFTSIRGLNGLYEILLNTEGTQLHFCAYKFAPTFSSQFEQALVWKTQISFHSLLSTLLSMNALSNNSSKFGNGRSETLKFKYKNVHKFPTATTRIPLLLSLMIPIRQFEGETFSIIACLIFL